MNVIELLLAVQYLDIGVYMYHCCKVLGILVSRSQNLVFIYRFVTVSGLQDLGFCLVFFNVFFLQDSIMWYQIMGFHVVHVV